MDKEYKTPGKEQRVSDVVVLEQNISVGDKDEEPAVLEDATRKATERAIIRKLDARLLPTVVLIFLMNYIDRVAVSSARLQGLEADLGLADTQYDTVLIIVYASYCPAQIPSNMVTRNFGDIVTCRVLLGVPEELAFRSGILYAGLLVSNAFGSGAITVFIGFQAMWLLPDYARLAEDAGEADQDQENASPFSGLWMALKDPKVPIFMIMNCAQLVGLSFISFFPTYVSIPPWVFAAICTLIGTWSADRTGERFFHMTAWWWVVMVGYIIALATHGIGPRYFSLFLMTTGYCGFTMVLVWVSNAIPRPPAKRSVAMGLVNGFGNVGALIGGYVWPTKWGPGYRPTMIIALCCLSFATCLSFLIRCILVSQNRALERSEVAALAPGGAERARIEEAARLEGISFDEAARRRRGFRYLL
ncbi:MFS general substrate transporter [Coniophora puteana RWD-64-598 SS2]|uniref:MFS general substrate transporter n=1 Tax=Coniophora puteana (strain RWD-64-598) TaxID=741705 RepID=A0A5M3MND9_CONPW|nr:MFS general substrate transporter [Coniophora puteana RWD-64-598 SS2]EIW80623.1 MFS general substrate transporter [Coniophora puteana RWD-64-598 SS2]